MLAVCFLSKKIVINHHLGDATDCWVLDGDVGDRDGGGETLVNDGGLFVRSVIVHAGGGHEDAANTIIYRALFVSLRVSLTLRNVSGG